MATFVRLEDKETDTQSLINLDHVVFIKRVTDKIVMGMNRTDDDFGLFFRRISYQQASAKDAKKLFESLAKHLCARDEPTASPPLGCTVT